MNTVDSATSINKTIEGIGKVITDTLVDTDEQDIALTVVSLMSKASVFLEKNKVGSNDLAGFLDTFMPSMLHLLGACLEEPKEGADKVSTEDAEPVA